MIPGFLLQVVALSLVLLYYFHAGFRAHLDLLADFKIRMGWSYSPITTALFGGLIPFLYLRMRPSGEPVPPYSHGVFYVLFWAYKGLEVDTLYHLQAFLFGVGHGGGVLIKKVFFDQFIYNPLWSAPMALVLFRWKDRGFALGIFRSTGWLSFFKEALPAAMISTWGVWIPTVAIIYSLPVNLQVPLFNVVLCFWVLMFTTLTRKKNGAQRQTG